MSSYHNLYYGDNEQNTLNNIRDNVDEFSEDEALDDVQVHLGEDTEPSIVAPTQFPSSVTSQSEGSAARGMSSRGGGRFSDIWIGQQFESKEDTINAIREYHINNSVDYVVYESKADIFVARCKQYGQGCDWRLRASKSKRRGKWEIKNLSGNHTCLNLMLSQDHRKLTSQFISCCISGLVEGNPSIPIKDLIAHVHSLYGYSVTYRKAWLAKQIALANLFGDWEESYNILPRWFTAVQHFVPGSIVRYDSSPNYVDGDIDPYSCILDRVFWAFKPCIEGFPYCKPIIQVDGTFLTGKYSGTLLVAVSQDGDRTVVPLAFAIVEGETKEAWVWFLSNLRMHVAHQQGVCIISDRGKGLLAALKDDAVGFVPPYALSAYCIRHIASNFNKVFRDADLKKRVINMGYELMRPRFEAKLDVLRADNRRAAEWLEKIPRNKWTQAYDEGRRYGHMTTNLAECINSVLKGTRALPITAIVKATFYRLSSLFVDRGTRILNMMREGHVFCEEARNTIQTNQQRAVSHYVRKFTRDTGEFEVQEMVNPQHGGRAMIYKVNLSEWWCDCGEFQAVRIPCSHAIASCAYVNLDSQQFIAPVYRLDFMFKIYEHEFHPIGNEEYWPPYSGMRFVPNWERRRDIGGRPRTSRIHNEMDERDDQVLSRCGLCRSQGHNRRSCPYRHTHIGQSSGSAAE